MPQLPDALDVGTLAKPEGRRVELPLLQEWAFDFEKMQFKVDENGVPYLVARNEALKIWLYWAVMTERGRWRANSRDYGAEIERMIGIKATTAIKSSELERTIREACEQCEYVKRVESINLDVDGDRVVALVHVRSVYDNEVVSVNVEV